MKDYMYICDTLHKAGKVVSGQVAGTDKAHSSVCRYMVFLPSPAWDANPLQGYPLYQILNYPFIHPGVERYCESKVSCQRRQLSNPD